MNFLLRASISGSLACFAAAAVLAVMANKEGRSAAQPLNATSHWLHGDRAAKVHRGDAKHTAVGLVTHQAAAILWGALFEKMRETEPSRTPQKIIRGAAIATSIEH
jgi:hypothetical protein